MENRAAASDSSAFGTLLRRYRLAAGLSQGELAERARLSAQAIGALERGYRRTPQRETLALLTEALALSPEQRSELEAAAVRRPVPRPGRSAVTNHPRLGASSNLPLTLTNFVGRTNELGEIAKLMREHRLVTLTGAGGIGKTRTALELAAVDSAADGVWLVELAPLGDPTLVVSAIASALRVQEVPDRPLLETLVASLRRKKLLLLVDNCEHVIAEAAHVVASLLRAVPGLRILATSREPLRVAGEQAYRLPSLSAPSLEAGRRLSANDAAAYEATALFVARARAVSHGMRLHDGNAPIVAEICRRLDGIPLAIELAAARVAALSLTTLAEKLDRCFALLTSGERSALPRQQTMRTTIDWSYQLLSHAEQRVFERLSVFAGGCSLEAAAAVCAVEGDGEPETFALLASLADKSLVSADFNGPEPRYDMLETFRQFAHEKLEAHGELDAVRRRHALTFLDLADTFEDEYDTTSERNWLASARLEMDNWRAALEYTLVTRADIRLGQRLAGKPRDMWLWFAPDEGRRWVRLAFDLIDGQTPPELVARLELARADFTYTAFGTSLAAGMQALEIYRRLDDRLGIASALLAAGSDLVRLGRPLEGETLLREALESFQTLGRTLSAAHALRFIGVARSMRGDHAQAREALSEALAIFQALDSDGGAGRTGFNLADATFLMGDVPTAFRLASDSLVTCRAQGQMFFALPLLSKLAAYAIALDRFDEARMHAREGLELAHEIQSPLGAAWAVQHHAAVAALGPHEDAPSKAKAYRRAAQLLGFVDARYATLENPLERAEQEEHDRVLAALRATIPAEELAQLMADGAAMTEEKAAEEARLI